MHTQIGMNTLSNDIQLAMEHLIQLMHRPSITPNDAGCQQYLQRVFNRLDMQCHSFEVEGVSNLIAKVGNGSTRIAFVSHSDITPVLYLENWSVEPYALTNKEGQLFGRGIAAMKGGIASMLAALEQVLPNLNLDTYSFYFLCTSDREGDAEYGTKEILEYLKQQNEVPHYCIIGEATSETKVGDILNVGRRGSIVGEVTILGVDGHVAGTGASNNSLHNSMMLGRWLTELSWDQGSKDFPGSQLKIISMEGGQSSNVMMPEKTVLKFNVLYSDQQNETEIVERVSNGLIQLRQLAKNIEIKWSNGRSPYLTSGNHLPTAGANYTGSNKDQVKIDLITEVEQAIYTELNFFPRLSTAGGASDGYLFAEQGCQVVEIGLPNNTSYKTDEHILVKDLHDLTRLYQSVLTRLMAN